MRLSVVIPAFNEENRIGASLRELTSYLPKHFEEWEIIVVDDGSHDKTSKIVHEIQQETFAERLSLHSLTKNQGKGASVRAGVLLAKYDYIIYMDADLSTPLSEIPKILAPLRDGIHVAIGSRSKSDSTIVEHQPFYRESMGKIFNLLVRALVINGFSDTQCGFKAFQRSAANEIFSRLKTNRFGFDVEVLLIAKKLKYSIREVGVVWINSPNSRVSPIRDSLEMLFSLFKIRFSVEQSIKKH